MNIHSPKFRYQIKRVLFITAGWILAGLYIRVIQYTSVVIAGAINPDKFSLKNFLFISAVEIFFGGLIVASFDVFYFSGRFRKKSFGYAVVVKTLFFATSLTLLTLAVYYVESLLHEERFNMIFRNLPALIFMTFFVWGLILLVTEFILQVSDKYGPGVLLKFIMGKYHSPKEEVRIFMFLDLKSSTTIAESLGNIKYFKLLNEIFYDVTDVIIETKGEIYQYVGDEIVICWKVKSGIENLNCLNCFFNIDRVLKGFSEKYQTNFGIVPTFKAGMHYGKVTVGEVGVLKKEITFSGDVLNTTSRIQELCNQYNESLLASKNLLDLMNLKRKFVTSEIGQINLRGKTAAIVIYSVKNV